MNKAARTHGELWLGPRKRMIRPATGLIRMPLSVTSQGLGRDIMDGKASIIASLSITATIDGSAVKGGA
jgi:hypothetical protein